MSKMKQGINKRLFSAGQPNLTDDELTGLRATENDVVLEQAEKGYDEAQECLFETIMYSRGYARRDAPTDEVVESQMGEARYRATSLGVTIAYSSSNGEEDFTPTIYLGQGQKISWYELDSVDKAYQVAEAIRASARDAEFLNAAKNELTAEEMMSKLRKNWPNITDEDAEKAINRLNMHRAKRGDDE